MKRVVLTVVMMMLTVSRKIRNFFMLFFCSLKIIVEGGGEVDCPVGYGGCFDAYDDGGYVGWVGCCKGEEG